MTVLPFAERGSLDDLISIGPVMGGEFAKIVRWTSHSIRKRGSSRPSTQTTGIGRALAYLHSREPPTYHGDLHTVNVLVTHTDILIDTLTRAMF